MGFDMDIPDHRFNRGELYNLSIKGGTLPPEDRFIINSHMVHTIVMLSKPPSLSTYNKYQPSQAVITKRWMALVIHVKLKQLNYRLQQG